MNSFSSPVMLPLDFDSREEALRVLKSIGSDLKWVKVGLQMYLKFGPDFVFELHQLGYRIFLDLKLYDIPNTVAGAIQSLGSLPVEFLTIHISGSHEMLKRAVEARDTYAPNIKLLGVSVLTSMDVEQMNRAGVSGEVSDQVLRLAQLAKGCDLDGLVCSPKELVMLQSNIEGDWLYVTPGIRPAGADQQDQVRIATPAEAIENGASYLVIGRPIYGNEDPKQALQDIHLEVKNV